MSLAEILARAAGLDESAIAAARVPITLLPDKPRPATRAVEHTSELGRVLSLPRRLWWRGLGGEWGTSEAVCDLLTAHLRSVNPADPDARLRLVQSAALQELHDFGGAVLPIRVGGGKTLVSLLAPVVTRAERPLLLVPASLRAKTLRERDEYARSWRVPEVVTDPADWSPGSLLLLSYTQLSTAHPDEDAAGDLEARRLGLLGELAPDLILCDEAQALRNRQSARTRRVDRYVRHRRRLEEEGDLRHGARLRFVAMTGTLAKRSLRDYGHLLEWALGPGSPAPRGWQALASWADALDEGVQNRPSVGALARLCDETEQDMLLQSPLEACRRGFGRRLVQTPGIVAVADGDQVESRLVIRALHHERGPEISDALARLRSRWETPGGEPLADKTAQWRHAREIACGFYYKWRDEPPEEWLEARREWCSFVRQVLKNNRRGLDTELQVVRACDRGEVPGAELARWRAVRDQFKPVTVSEWLSDEILELAAAWMARNPLGLVWTEHLCVGQRLAELSGAPFFGGVDARSGARGVEKHDGPAILSVRANSTGRNLQKWCSNLVLGPLTSGQDWEQMLGRTHRDGQTAPEVTVDVLFACSEHFETWIKARADAEFLEHSTTVRQKLLSGDVQVSAPDPAPKNW